MSKLNDQQVKFCEEYLLDLNATQAALRAGYSEDNAKNNGNKLMSNPAVRAHIAALIDERSKRTLVSADYLITSLVTVLNRCLQGEPVRIWDTKQRCWVDTGEWKFDAIGATRVLDLLCRHLGMFSKQNTSAPSNPSTFGTVNPEQFEMILNAIRNDEPFPNRSK